MDTDLQLGLQNDFIDAEDFWSLGDLPVWRCNEIMNIAKKYVELILNNTDEFFNVEKFLKDNGAILIPYSAFNMEEIKKLYTIKKSFWQHGLCYSTVFNDGSGQYCIFYNDRLDSQSKMVVLLHEFGHMVLKHTEHCDLAEKEAFYFAGLITGAVWIKWQLILEACL